MGILLPMIMLKETLLKKMTDRALSRRALSLMADLDESMVKKLIKGTIPHPRLDTVIKLAGALDCGLDELVFGKEARGINEGVLIKSITTIDEIIAEKSLTMTEEKRAASYIKLYRIELLKTELSQKDKIETILNLIDSA